jgi:phage-related protein
MKPLQFLGDALKRLRAFPDDARQEAGFQLDKVQRGEQPDDFKPMSSIGGGVEDIRVREESEAVFVLHAFQKKTQTTAKRDMDLACERFAQLARSRK